MEYIEVLGLVITASVALLGGIWALFKFYDNRQESRTGVDREVSLKISELQIKILQIEKEVGDMKNRHECDFANLRKDLMGALSEFKSDNKDANCTILKKLDTQNEILIKLSTNFENHVGNHERRRKATE